MFGYVLGGYGEDIYGAGRADKDEEGMYNYVRLVSDCGLLWNMQLGNIYKAEGIFALASSLALLLPYRA
jgi:hypothetical protein